MKIVRFPRVPERKLVIVKAPQPRNALGALGALFDPAHTRRSLKRYMREQEAVADAQVPDSGKNSEPK